MTISGVVDKIIYRNADNGYTVLSLETPEGELSTVGILPLVAEGEQIEIEGDYVNNAKYGRQFVVTTFTSRLPIEETAILRYLSSGIVKGIRAKTARLLVETFGPSTLEVIENEPEKLSQIRGISPERAENISRSMKENIGVKTVLLYFQQVSITPTVAFKIYKQFGLAAYDILRANPYRLCEIQGIGFEKADQMAESMGFDRTSPFRLRAGIQYILTQNLYNNGHTFIPRDKLAATAQPFLDAEETDIYTVLDALCADGTLEYVPKIGNADGIYLKWVYECERNVANRVLLASRFYDDYTGDFARDIETIEQELELTLAEKQKLAVRESACHQMMILTGGPGTGKTTTLRAIIRLLETKGESVALAAPTGRAAKRAGELTGKEAKTIHRLLEYTPQGTEYTFLRNHANPLPYDAVIIDESSMVDLWLFDHLLDALPVNSRLILVGDVNQLPPVGPGSVLKDIIGSNLIPCVALTEIFRQAKESLIVTNAHRILNGELPVLTDVKRDFFYLRTNTPEETVEKTVELAAVRLPAAYGFSPETDIQVLCPSRKGPTGTAALNLALKERINPSVRGKKEFPFRDMIFREGDKVMQTKNNYDLVTEHDSGELDTGVYNGDLGIIERVSAQQESVTVRFDDRIVVYPSENLEELEPAYAVTVHKSQGSEFNAVILPLLEGPDLLYTRNLLYTAVTRAKRLLILVGSTLKISQMLRSQAADKRYSGLKFMLQGL